jgi:hypothetical protein
MRGHCSGGEWHNAGDTYSTAVRERALWEILKGRCRPADAWTARALEADITRARAKRCHHSGQPSGVGDSLHAGATPPLEPSPGRGEAPLP